MPIDLHVHTTASDGSLTPREVMTEAARKGLSVIGVTDHDTLAGLPEAEEAGAELGVEVISGVEITTGGIIIIPIDINTAETTKSISRNGM